MSCVRIPSEIPVQRHHVLLLHYALPVPFLIRAGERERTRRVECAREVEHLFEVGTGTGFRGVGLVRERPHDDRGAVPVAGVEFWEGAFMERELSRRIVRVLREADGRQLVDHSDPVRVGELMKSSEYGKCEVRTQFTLSHSSIEKSRASTTRSKPLPLMSASSCLFTLWQ